MQSHELEDLTLGFIEGHAPQEMEFAQVYCSSLIERALRQDPISRSDKGSAFGEGSITTTQIACALIAYVLLHVGKALAQVTTQEIAKWAADNKSKLEAHETSLYGKVVISPIFVKFLGTLAGNVKRES